MGFGDYLEKIDQEASSVITETMDIFNNRGVGRIIRIVPDPEKESGFNIMSMFHYDRDVKIATCSSFDEALKYIGKVDD